MITVAGEVAVIDPNVVRGLNTNGVSRASKNFGNFQVTENDVALVEDADADALEGFPGSGISGNSRAAGQKCNTQEPAAPRRDVFEPTLTTVSPEMVPSMMTTFLESPLTALVSAERVETRVTEPPEPPVVLQTDKW